jgi:hypothetical protein
MCSLKDIAKAKYRRFQARKEQNTTDFKTSARPQTPTSDPSILMCRESAFPDKPWDYSSEETARLATWFIQHQYHANHLSPMSPADRKAFLDRVEVLLRKCADPFLTIGVYEVGKRVIHRILGAQYDDDPTRGRYGGLVNLGSTVDDETVYNPLQKPRLKSLLTPFFESIALGDFKLIALFLRYGMNAGNLTRNFKLSRWGLVSEAWVPLSVSHKFQLIRYLAEDSNAMQDIFVQTWVLGQLLEILGLLNTYYVASYHWKALVSTTLEEKIARLRARSVFTAVPIQAIRLVENIPSLLTVLLDVRPVTHIAVALDNVSLLHAALADGHKAQHTDWQQISTLHIAVSNTSSKMCQHLLSLGVDFDATDCFGITPLQEAVYWGHSGAVRMLLNIGAKIFPSRESQNDRRLSFREPPNLFLSGEWRASRNKNFALFSQLEWTILHIAVWAGSWPIVQTLIDGGAAPELQDLSGRTPLDLAIELARFEITANLLQADAPFDNTCLSASILLEKAFKEREQHVIDQLRMRGVKRLPPDIHSPAYVRERRYEDHNEPSVTRSLGPPLDLPSGHMWNFYRRLPAAGCSHIQDRKSEADQAELTASTASASRTCNMCRLVNRHLKNSQSSIRLGATVELDLLHIRETRKWELMTCISGEYAQRHTVKSVPCMQIPISFALVKLYLLNCTVNLHTVLNDIPYLEDRSTESLAAMRISKYWLANCIEMHSVCQGNDLTYSPTRLIEVLEGGMVRIVQSTSSAQIYIALSHRWSQDETSKTTLLNLAERLLPFQASLLSPVLQDTIKAVKSLGYHFVWIDMLCIIQDSEQDWLHEAAEMRHVYSNADITIAAECTSATGEATNSGGMFRRRDLRESRPFPLQQLEEYTDENLDYLVQSSENPGDEQLYIFPDGEQYRTVRKKGILDTRGWILQEQLLSPRILYFGHQMYWDCITEVASEVAPMGASLLDVNNSGETWAFRLLRKTIAGKGDPKMLAKLIADVWIHVVQNYSARTLTKQSDKLIALQGVIAALESVLRVSSVAGMWQQGLWKQLTYWIVTPANFTYNANPPFSAPTWSWLSVDGAVSHYHSMRLHKYPIQLDDLAPLPELRCTITTLLAEPTIVWARLDLSAPSFFYTLTTNDLREMTWKQGHPGNLNLAPACWMPDGNLNLPRNVQCVIIAEDEVAKMTVGLCLVAREAPMNTWERVGVFLWEGLRWQIAKYAGKELQIKDFAVF